MSLIYYLYLIRSLDVKKEGSDESGKEITSAEEPLALTKWRTAVGDAKSASQLAVCMNELEKNIAWEKSPMKVVCKHVIHMVDTVVQPEQQM